MSKARRKLWRRGSVRKTIVASMSVLALACSGCGSDGAETAPEAAPEGPAPSQEQGPERSAPAKSVELADNCAIVTEDQASSLGTDQPPEPRQSNDIPGCSYNFGETAEWYAFVAIDRSKNFDQFVETSLRPPEFSDLAGYPMAQVQINERGCLTSVDISDEAALWVNTLISDGSRDTCETGAQFAGAALQNLQDAPGGQ